MLIKVILKREHWLEPTEWPDEAVEYSVFTDIAEKTCLTDMNKARNLADEGVCFSENVTGYEGVLLIDGLSSATKICCFLFSAACVTYLCS